MEQIRLLLKITLFWWGFQRRGGKPESGVWESFRVLERLVLLEFPVRWLDYVPSLRTRVIELVIPGTVVPAYRLSRFYGTGFVAVSDAGFCRNREDAFN
jgi:hypothetical protein